MITITISGPKGDAPELANGIAHLIEQDGKTVRKVENGSVPVLTSDRPDVLIIISQEE